ncbi:phage tail protein [Salmonella enterica subsp. enterica]|nr:phage tail protein [Salmonella enterica subsp. enterica]
MSKPEGAKLLYRGSVKIRAISVPGCLYSATLANGRWHVIRRVNRKNRYQLM